MICVKDVTVVRWGKALFQNFNWEIARGENWVISGRNGSGKTILLETLAGMIHLTQGGITYDFITGATWDERHVLRTKRIKYIPAHAIQSLIQNTSSGYYQQRYYHSGNEPAPCVRDIIGDDMGVLSSLRIPEALSISPLLSREVTRLSNGQLKKVLLTKKLASGIPDLLLLDYPFEGLDATSRQELHRFLDFIHEQHGVHIILSDHAHALPHCINRRLVLERFQASSGAQVHIDVRPPDGVVRKVTPDARQNDVIIELKDVSVRYGETVIAGPLNWIVGRGERWALIGKNGSGKTTLFSMIFADHPQAYTQEIYLFGRRRGTGESIWEIKDRIAFLGPEVVSFMNAKDIRISARDYLGRKQKADIGKVGFLIQFFDAADFIDEPVHALGSGQLQLVQVMDCFLSEKELILLDEPFQFLDPQTIDRVRLFLTKWLSPSSTLILITHYERNIPEWTEKTFRL